MNARLLTAAMIAATMMLAAGTFATGALAAAADYRLEAVPATLPVGEEAVVALRLVHASSGKPVPNAVIFRTRLDMAPDAMGEMVEPMTPVESAEPGVYRFRTRLSMAGRWAMTVQAKVPGETETVRASVVVTGVERPGGGAGHSHGH